MQTHTAHNRLQQLHSTMSSPKLFLHDHPASSYAQKVRMVLREKNIPFDMATPGNIGSGSKLPGLSDANPRVEVPALLDGDFKIFDSKVICQYLEDKYPEHPLMPKDPRGRAETKMIEEICDTVFEAINWGQSEINWCERATGELADKLLGQAKAQTKILCDWLAEKLGDKPYFGGETFGYADICCTPYVNRAVVYGNGPEEGTPLREWRERVMQRESVRITTEEMQAAAKQMATGLKAMFGKGSGRRREYRDHRLEWMIKAGGIEVVRKGLEEDTIRFSWPGGI